MVRPHLLDVVELLRLEREGIHLRTHCLSPEHRVVTEPADTHDTNLLTWATAVRLEGRVDGEAGAEHRRGVRGLDLVRDGEHKALVRANGGRVPALGDDSVVILAILSVRVSRKGHTEIIIGRRAYVSVQLIWAVVLVALVARPAFHAAGDLRADADALADLELIDLVADTGDVPDDLVAGDERQLGFAPTLAERMDVGAAHAAVGDGDLDIVFFEGLRLERRQLEVRPLRWV